jgi:hypothetical protein
MNGCCVEERARRTKQGIGIVAAVHPGSTCSPGTSPKMVAVSISALLGWRFCANSNTTGRFSIADI